MPGRKTWVDEEIVSYTKLQDATDQGVIICTSSTHPSSPIEGMRIYETDTFLTKVYDGSAYFTLARGLIRYSDITQTGPTIADSDTLINGSAVAFDCYEDELYEYRVWFAPTSAFSTTDVDSYVYDTVTCKMQLSVDGGGEDPVGNSTDIFFGNATFPSYQGSTFWVATESSSAAFSATAAFANGLGQVPPGGWAAVYHWGTLP